MKEVPTWHEGSATEQLATGCGKLVGMESDVMGSGYESIAVHGSFPACYVLKGADKAQATMNDDKML